MEKITKKINELADLIKEHKPTKAEARKFALIRSYILLAQNAAAFKSRVVVNKYEPKTDEPKEQPKPKRGRPKKENKNLLATSAKPKTLEERLNDEK